MPIVGETAQLEVIGQGWLDVAVDRILHIVQPLAAMKKGQHKADVSQRGPGERG